MTLPVTITGISTAVAPVGPFKSSGGAYYFFGRDGTTATTLQAYKALNTAASIAPAGVGAFNFGGAAATARRGQTWTHDGSTVPSVTVKIWKVGAPTDTVTAEIYATNVSGLPTGSALFTSTNTISGTSLGTVSGAQAPVNFNFSGVTTLAASVKYAVVLARSGAIDSVNYYRCGGDAADTYAGGMSLTYSNTSGLWIEGSANEFTLIVNAATSDTAPESSWAGIANKTGFTTAILNIAAHQVGDVIHMLMQDGTAPAALVATKYLSFNMATDTFLATTETVSAASIQTGTAASGWGCSLVVRSNGNVVCFYNGVQTKVSTQWSRVYYRVRTGVNTFAAAEAMVDAGLGVNNTAPIAVLGASDRAHLLFFNGTNTLQRHLTSANVLGTVASTGATTAVQDACRYDDAGTIRHVGFTAAQSIRWASADNPTVTAASMTTGTPVRATDDGTTVHALYQNSADSDLYVKSSTDNGATFGSGTNVFTGTVAAADANVSKNQLIYQRGSNFVIPFIVNDGGTLKYNEHIVRTVSVAITGTLSVTESADAISAAGTVAGGAAITGTLNVTEANDTIAAAATVTVRGTLSQTEANDTISSTATVGIGGTLNVTEANDTLSAAATIGYPTVTGALDVTESSDTVSAAGGPVARGTLSATEANDILTAAGGPVVIGSLNVTEASDTISATASVSLVGALSLTEANDTLSATGTVEAVAAITGSLNVTEANDAVSSAGTVTVSVALSVTEANDTLSAAATVAVSGTLNVTETNDAIAAAGIVSDGAAVTGALNVTEVDDTISALATVAGEVEPPIFVGGGGRYYAPPRPYPVEGVGYGILPPIEGEAFGTVSVGSAGVGLGLLPRFAGQATAAIGAAGSSQAQLEIKAAASGQAGAQARGFGMIMKIEGAAVGRQSDDDAAAVTFLLAA